MARPLRVPSLLGGLSALVSASSRRFAGGGVNRTWTEPGTPRAGLGSRRGTLPDGAEEVVDVEDKMQALVTEEKRRWKTARYHMMRRRMTPPGAPQRKLTWEAMEQIRYLKQEQPEEWTVEQLADGFSVTADVVRRVLKSKFVASPERRQKQNAKVVSAVGGQALPSGSRTRPDRRALPGNNRTPAVLPAGGTDGASVAGANRTQVIPGERSGSRPPSLVRLAASPARHADARGVLMTTSTEDVTETAEEDEEDEEGWDGRVLTERELEELMEGEKASPVVQVGGDFFDAEGNFLYRVCGYSALGK